MGSGQCVACATALYADSKWVKNVKGLWCIDCYHETRTLSDNEGSIDYERIAAILLQRGTLEDIESVLIKAAIKLEKGNMTKAARRLGIGRATIYRKTDRPESVKDKVT